MTLRTLAVLALLAGAGRAQQGCLSCHGGIEEMHPWAALSCTDCHGGDGDATTIGRAHVEPRYGWPDDERVLHPAFEPEAVRFRNPSDLRVLPDTCGSTACHPGVASRLVKSLHGTTAGHLNDGLYENGLLAERESRYGVFGVSDDDGRRGEHGLEELLPISALRADPGPGDGIGAHFADLPRKACMQCHLWSDGVAIDGRLGQEGLHRGSGCAACHVSYAEDGLSRGGDPTTDRFEPGHPLRHELVLTPPTSNCTPCHVGDASIGNGFRGLAQLYPNQPAGPDVPGTTDRMSAGQFFLTDPLLLPADLHHDAGMQCTDCHTARDAMGDGDIVGAMEHAVGIECVSCHGDFDAPAELRTERGRVLAHVERSGPTVTLVGKTDGFARRVKQAAEVVDPEHPDFDPDAARAMTGAHAGLECYACHAGWNTNFFGFHFDRNASFTQLDTISGNRTPGRVTTQERVFATLRRLTLGVNPEGMIAPYMVGFSTMGTARGEDGELLVDQELPATAAALSGMTMVHHQTHTTQRAARSCVECHRSPATWGLGSGNASYTLARGLVVTVGESGLQTLMLDRAEPGRSIVLARLPIGGARKVVLDAHVVSGHAETAFVVVEHAGVALVDLRNPAFPAMRAFVAAGDARDAALAGDLLVIANGVGGVRLVDVSDRDAPRLVSDVVTTEARGVSVQWPRVLVADGPGGLLVVDVASPEHPRVVGDVSALDDAHAVRATFQYGRPQGHDARTGARMLAVVANGRHGFALVDVTEPEAPTLIASPRYGARVPAIDVALASRFDLGDPSGGQPTVERDVAYVVFGREGDEPTGSLALVDVTDPRRPVVLDRLSTRRVAARGGAVAHSWLPPRLVRRFALATDGGLGFVDATDPDAVVEEAQLATIGPLADVAFEAFAFDRMVDESGRQLKDISHAGARYLDATEIHRVLTVPGEALGTLDRPAAARADAAALYGDDVLPGGEVGRGRGLGDPNDEQRVEMLSRLQRGFRIAEAEDLGRLVRHVDPAAYDRNGDEALGRGEFERLLFEILDANGDGRLDVLEWPRHPAADAPALDSDRDGVVSRREMDVDDDTLRFFDVDGDGAIALSEWPFEVAREPFPSLAYASVEDLRALLEDRDFRRTQPALYRLATRGREPGEVSDDELADVIEEVRSIPELAYPAPGFVARFDLDRDGAVEPGEFSAWDAIAARCDTDRNGVIDARDAGAARTRRR